jgi:hypothetical protein
MQGAPDRSRPPGTSLFLAEHEDGHWMGLGRTFNFWLPNGTEAGDEVADTPEHQANTRSDCHVEPAVDTIPEAPGLDPVHNFMNDTGDSCMSEFTLGQEQRMDEQFSRLRLPYAEDPETALK